VRRWPPSACITDLTLPKSTPKRPNASVTGQTPTESAYANALLGVVQIGALLADTVELDDEAKNAAGEEQLVAAGAGVEHPVARV